MLSEKILASYFQNQHTYKVPLVFASECLMAIEQVLKKEMEEDRNAKLSELFDE